jgi:DNA polymerase III delta prime subunit
MDQDILRHLRRWEGTTVYPIILLGGPSGIGKTTQARILSRDLGIPYTSHDLHGNANAFLQHLSAILREHHCAIVDRVFLDGNMAWIEELKAIMLPYGVMDVALFPIFPVIHDDLVEIALQNMEKRTIALEETAYADEPNRMKCGKTMEDRRKILQKQLEGSQTIKKAAYVEIMDKGVQRSIMDVALAYRCALAGLLHQYCHSGSKKRKMET